MHSSSFCRVGILFGRHMIVPSLCYENSPTVIYEAFSQGVPVIAADIGGVAELVKEGETGFVFEADSTDSLLKAIKKAEKENNYIEMSRKCIEYASQFNIKDYCKTLID